MICHKLHDKGVVKRKHLTVIMEQCTPQTDDINSWILATKVLLDLADSQQKDLLPTMTQTATKTMITTTSLPSERPKTQEQLTDTPQGETLVLQTGYETGPSYTEWALRAE